MQKTGAVLNKRSVLSVSHKNSNKKNTETLYFALSFQILFCYQRKEPFVREKSKMVAMPVIGLVPAFMCIDVSTAENQAITSVCV